MTAASYQARRPNHLLDVDMRRGTGLPEDPPDACHFYGV